MYTAPCPPFWMASTPDELPLIEILHITMARSLPYLARPLGTIITSWTLCTIDP